MPTKPEGVLGVIEEDFYSSAKKVQNIKLLLEDLQEENENLKKKLKDLTKNKIEIGINDLNSVLTGTYQHSIKL